MSTGGVQVGGIVRNFGSVGGGGSGGGFDAGDEMAMRIAFPGGEETDGRTVYHASRATPMPKMTVVQRKARAAGPSGEGLGRDPDGVVVNGIDVITGGGRDVDAWRVEDVGAGFLPAGEPDG